MKKTVWLVVSCLMVGALVLASCAPAVTEEEEAAPAEEEEVVTEEEEVAPAEEEEVVTEEEEEAPPPEEEVVTEEEEAAQPEEEEVAPPTDTTPPSAITGLIAGDAYDGRVNLSWDKSTAEDFDHYDIYVSQAEIVDASGMTPVHQITNIATNTYQATGLEDGARYYFAVTAVDKSGNEDTLVTCVSTTTTPMPRGTVDPDISVDIYQSEMAWAGTTLLPDNHNPESPRVIEVNMLGEIVWEYRLPQNLKQYTNPGFDVESLTNNNILLVLPRSGVYEIDRNGKIVWSYLDEKVSHDADRLPNGNTIFVFGNDDQKSDAQVTEVNPEGEIVWTWYARDHFDKSPYKDIYDEGWTHTNAVTRMSNGNTLISPRNFSFVVEVDPQGSVIRTIGEGILGSVHDPEILPNGNLLATTTRAGETGLGEPCVRAVEIDLETGKIVWQSPISIFGGEAFPVRDANRLPNGNTLITGSTKIVEVTTEGEIVWQLTLKGVTFDPGDSSRLGFYKADRIAIQ